MAGALNIKSGTKLTMAYDVPFGENPKFDLISTYAKAIDESAFLISIPMKGGRPLELDFTRKLLLRYSQGSDQIILAGYADDLVKEGIRKYWKIRRVQEQRQFFQRADERYKVALKLDYMQPDWPLNDHGEIDREEAMTLDISAGGIAVYLNRAFDVGETVFFKMPRIGTNPEGYLADDVVGVVCWMREAPKGSVYRRVCGLQYRFADDEEKQRVRDYISYVKLRYRL